MPPERSLSGGILNFLSANQGRAVPDFDLPGDVAAVDKAIDIRICAEIVPCHCRTRL